MQFVCVGQVLVVFNGVCYPAQQVSVADHLLQGVGQLWNGQGKSTGNTLENPLLVGQVCCSR